ncbi:Predicted cobalt transporter CbtA, partial [hydrothermal vent metagenome]
MLFRKLIIIACLSAIISGFILGTLQSFSTTKIIYSAEKYEVTEHEHTHDIAHEDNVDEEWGPKDGAERVGYTYLADILIAFGHSLLLTSFMALMYLKFGKPEISWRSGLIIGMGGYLSFYLATVMGLPPEVPGTLAADLQLRQIWWTLTVVATV